MTPRPFPSTHHREAPGGSGAQLDDVRHLDAAGEPGGPGSDLEGPQPEGRQVEDVTLSELWFQMLIDLYELPEALPEVLPTLPIPDGIWETLRRGRVPSRSSLKGLGPEWRAELRLQTGCACGFRHLQRIGYEEVCDRVGRLQAQGEDGPYLGGCLVLLLALVLSLPPSALMVEQLTNGYSNAEEDLERTERILFELILALLARHTQEVLRAIDAGGEDPLSE